MAARCRSRFRASCFEQRALLGKLFKFSGPLTMRAAGGNAMFPGHDMDPSSITGLTSYLGAYLDQATPKSSSAEQQALIQAVKAVNSAGLLGQDQELTLWLVPNLHQTVVRVVNRDTREVVAEIPTERALQLAQELRSKGDESGQ